MSASLHDLRILLEVAATIAVTWLLLGWYFDTTVTQVDGAAFVTPFTRSQLAAGCCDWTAHSYRFGVLGGAPMHAYAGTLPLVQLASALGLSTTSTVNLGTLYLQVCFGFFGLVTIEALIARWSTRPRRLGLRERVVSVWFCAFAPALAWRLSLGHENILQGLLPLLVMCALLGAARANRLSPLVVLVGFFAVWNGVSGLGGQLLIYSALFGAPIAVVVLLGVRPWTRATAAAMLTVGAGVLVALPRLSVMLAFAGSDDASRSLADSVSYDLGNASWADWLASIAWTRDVATGGLVHETNYPLGPLLSFVVFLWPHGRSRALLVAIAGSAVFAILFAANVPPISTVISNLPLVGAFRIPARAILPVVVLLPMLAVALFWIARETALVLQPDPPQFRFVGWLALAVAIAMIASHGRLPGLLRESTAWLTCIGVAIILRWKPMVAQRSMVSVALAAIAALGVLAFDERLVRGIPSDPIERGPHQLHDAVIEQAPELAMPLNRIQLIDAPRPYRVGLGFAAGLSTLDGDFNPPSRFVRLLSALNNRPLSSTTVIFDLGRSRNFPILQQLYNVRYGLVFGRDDLRLDPLPPTPGPAWLPRHLEALANDAEVAAALRSHASDLRSVAWVNRSDATDIPSTCDGTLDSIATDSLGQVVTIQVTTRSACVVVVATNYIRALRATTATSTALHVVPVDIALTGIVVPAGNTRFTLGPVVVVPLWAHIAMAFGWLFLVAGVALVSRSPCGGPSGVP
jgi:hypothetical protein